MDFLDFVESNDVRCRLAAAWEGRSVQVQGWHCDMAPGNVRAHRGPRPLMLIFPASRDFFGLK